MADIVIVGAGLSGLSAAYHLEQQGFHDYKIFEKDSTAGGLCRSIQQDGFTFDYTGHLLHTSDPYFKHFIDTVLGINNLNIIKRRSFIYACDAYSAYPYQINLYGRPPEVIAECIDGFVNRVKSRKKPRSFYDWVLHTFGAGLGKHFFFPFQEKIFAYPIKKITPSWTGRFVPKTSLVQMISGALTDRSIEDIGYNANFFYPKARGINFLIEQIIKNLKNPIHTNYCVERVDMQAKQVIFTNGNVEHFKHLITTIPLDHLLTQLQTPSTVALKNAAKKLVCNSVVNFNLGIQRADLTQKHWIYYPEKLYPFYRLGFPHNFSSSMTPSGCSSLYGEFSYIKKSPQAIRALLDQALAITKKLFSLSDAEIITQKVILINHAYVIFDAWRDKHIAPLLKQLADANIYSVGRYGAWKYASMQEAVLDGKKIAQMLIAKHS